MKYNEEYLIETFVKYGIGKTEISQKYSLELLDLYKISKILNSGRCSDYNSFLELFIKKHDDFDSHTMELYDVIDNMEQNALLQYKDLTIQFLTNLISSINDKEQKAMHEECLNTIRTMDNEKFRQILKGCFRAHNLGFQHKLAMEESVLNNIDYTKLEQLNIDSELERIKSLLPPEHQREYDMNSYCAYILHLGVANNVIQNEFIPTISHIFSKHIYPQESQYSQSESQTPKL